MKKKKRGSWYPFALIGAAGFLLGLIAAGIIAPPVHHGNRRGVSVEQWTATRDAWLKDREDWREGKPFAYSYGPHGERW